MLNKGGHTVKAGTYWNLANGSRVQMEQEGALPGDGQTRYIKAPVAPPDKRIAPRDWANRL